VRGPEFTPEFTPEFAPEFTQSESVVGTKLSRRIGGTGRRNFAAGTPVCLSYQLIPKVLDNDS